MSSPTDYLLNRNSQSLNEKAPPDKGSQPLMEMPVSVRNLTKQQWKILFDWVEECLVVDYGLFLPTYWYQFTGIATECMTLCFEYLALSEAQTSPSAWLSHLEGFARRLGGPWLTPNSREEELTERSRRAAALYYPDISPSFYKQQRSSTQRFMEWLNSENRPLPSQIPLKKLRTSGNQSSSSTQLLS